MARLRKRAPLIVGVLLLLFLLVSVPAWALQTNPPVRQEPAWDSPQTRALAQRACFDCHSNETRWPWFTRIPPGSWLATWDTVRGRRELNFSEWGVARRGGEGSRERAGGREGGGEGGGEMGEVIREGKMPPGNYLLLHPEARLSTAEQQQLISGFQASLR